MATTRSAGEHDLAAAGGGEAVDGDDDRLAPVAVAKPANPPRSVRCASLAGVDRLEVGAGAEDRAFLALGVGGEDADPESSSSSSWSMAASRPSATSPLTALRASGRFSVITATCGGSPSVANVTMSPAALAGAGVLIRRRLAARHRRRRARPGRRPRSPAASAVTVSAAATAPPRAAGSGRLDVRIGGDRSDSAGRSTDDGSDSTAGVSGSTGVSTSTAGVSGSTAGVSTTTAGVSGSTAGVSTSTAGVSTSTEASRPRPQASRPRPQASPPQRRRPAPRRCRRLRTIRPTRRTRVTGHVLARAGRVLARLYAQRLGIAALVGASTPNSAATCGSKGASRTTVPRRSSLTTAGTPG